jgi:hypothetical protein
MTNLTKPKPSKIQIGIAILWPSFLIAAVATGLFFSAFDPEYLFPFNTEAEVSHLGVYSIGFFLFWLMSALSGIGTLYFSLTNDALTKNHSISKQSPYDNDQK